MKNEKLIALYFEGKLSNEEQLLFDTLLKTDVAFKEQVELEQQTKKAIISIKKDELRDRLKQLENPKKRFNYYTIAIAASLVIALGLFTLLKPTEAISNDALFAEYYEPYANIIAPASRGEVATDQKFEAFRHYDARNYELAAQKFEQLYSETNTSYYLFYQAICELQLNNTGKAIALFKAHKQFTDKLSSQTNWYLALAYLKSNDTKEAKVLLQNISNEKAYNYQFAETILKKIK